MTANSRSGSGPRRHGFPDSMPAYEFGSVALTWALIVARLKDVVESGGVPNPVLG